MRQQIAVESQYGKGKNMKPTVGLGSDYRKAVIEENFYRGVNTAVIRPNAEKQPQLSAGVGLTAPCKSQMVFGDDSRRRTDVGQPNTSSDEVVAAIRRVEDILFFGSAEAKSELKKSLAGCWFCGLVEALETCVDTMTEHQMIKVREEFQK